LNGSLTKENIQQKSSYDEITKKLTHQMLCEKEKIYLFSQSIYTLNTENINQQQKIGRLKKFNITSTLITIVLTALLLYKTKEDIKNFFTSIFFKNMELKN
jgi:hypothetical protein